MSSCSRQGAFQLKMGFPIVGILTADYCSRMNQAIRQCFHNDYHIAICFKMLQWFSCSNYKMKFRYRYLECNIKCDNMAEMVPKYLDFLL